MVGPLSTGLAQTPPTGGADSGRVQCWRQMPIAFPILVFPRYLIHRRVHSHVVFRPKSFDDFSQSRSAQALGAVSGNGGGGWGGALRRRWAFFRLFLRERNLCATVLISPLDIK